MRHFHKLKNHYVRPVINLDKVWTLIGEEKREACAKDTWIWGAAPPFSQKYTRWWSRPQLQLRPGNDRATACRRVPLPAAMNMLEQIQQPKPKPVDFGKYRKLEVECEHYRAQYFAMHCEVETLKSTFLTFLKRNTFSSPALRVVGHRLRTDQLLLLLIVSIPL